MQLDWTDVRLLRYFLDKDNSNIHEYLSIDRSPGAGIATTHKRQTKVTWFHILFVVNVAAVQKIITIYTIGEL